MLQLISETFWLYRCKRSRYVNLNVNLIKCRCREKLAHNVEQLTAQLPRPAHFKIILQSRSLFVVEVVDQQVQHLNRQIQRYTLRALSRNVKSIDLAGMPHYAPRIDLRR